jgi:hypothetical protein
MQMNFHHHQVCILRHEIGYKSIEQSINSNMNLVWIRASREKIFRKIKLNKSLCNQSIVGDSFRTI